MSLLGVGRQYQRGCLEMLDGTGSASVNRDVVDAMEREIRYIKENAPFAIEACTVKFKEFDMIACSVEYVKIYK